ncbi:hypothetical protein [Nannocystis pusilla]|uniref:hypothetical protein n=1 Tax=Nannocystis pusilla TaxID=889268 RepID=UPI003B81215A
MIAIDESGGVVYIDLLSEVVHEDHGPREQGFAEPGSLRIEAIAKEDARVLVRDDRHISLLELPSMQELLRFRVDNIESAQLYEDRLSLRFAPKWPSDPVAPATWEFRSGRLDRRPLFSAGGLTAAERTPASGWSVVTDARGSRSRSARPGPCIASTAGCRPAPTRHPGERSRTSLARRTCPSTVSSTPPVGCTCRPRSPAPPRTRSSVAADATRITSDAACRCRAPNC